MRRNYGRGVQTPLRVQYNGTGKMGQPSTHGYGVVLAGSHSSPVPSLLRIYE